MNANPNSPEGLLSLVAGMADSKNRRATAQALAEHAGARDLIIFIQDRELGVLLPAPGFQQTLPEMKRWHAFLAACRLKTLHVGKLPSPITREPVQARGFAGEDGSVAVFLDGEEMTEVQADIARLLPIMAAAFQGERFAAISKAGADVARRTAAEAKLLAVSLDKAHNELRLTLAEAQRANAAKDRFLAVLSHELRTPLNPVLMAASAMEADPQLPEQIRSDISMIRRNVELEAKLIDDMLDLTRIANGKVQLQRKIVDAHALLQETVSVVRAEPSADFPELKLHFNAGHAHVDADSARLQQVMWNLIRNAVKFTPKGGLVTVQTSNPDAARFRFEVIDTGIGIPPEALPKIFDAFEQAGTEINHLFGGLGLGLAISKNLVEMHGGTIRAESDGADKGARFTFDLPVVAPPTTCVATAPAVAPAAAPRRILLVEDHPSSAAVLVRLLRRRGHEVHHAATKAEAIATAQQHTFDLMISDLGLPDGTGFEVLEAVRVHSAMKAIALTGYGMESDVGASERAGFHFHLTKPVDAQKLLQAIEQVCATEA